MSSKNVDNVRGEKENAVRRMEDEQRKYWRIVGQNHEKYGIGYIAYFREQYKEIANVKIEEAKQKLEEQQHTLENAFPRLITGWTEEILSQSRKPSSP